MKKDRIVMDKNHLAVIGKTYMVPFDKELEYEKLELKRSRGMQTFNEEITETLLKHIHYHRNIRDDCIKEMVEKEKEEREMGHNIPIDEECLKKRCRFRNDCRRMKLQ